MMPQASLHQILVELLANSSLSLPLIALTADVIAANARFNYWCLSEAKPNLDSENLMKMLESYEDLDLEYGRRLEEFKKAPDEDALGAALNDVMKFYRTAFETYEHLMR
jgi:hypothetical protein